MKNRTSLLSITSALVTTLLLGSPALAAATVQVGASGKTYASSLVKCAANPSTGELFPVVEAGLYNPTTNLSASVALNGANVAKVTNTNPAVNVWLADGNNTVLVRLNKKTADKYVFTVQPGVCALPDTSSNTFSADGVLEYAASGKSYSTVTAGCAFNPATGQAQPFVNLFDNGGYLLNVSINDKPLTQLSASRPRTPVFLSAGLNVISAANGFTSIDYYVRDGGDGTCTLP
ncbi:hypothetical protein [Methylomonas rosea]|uniref:Uncharacterized protein n=1 Tax=Methylomonas rosea TaxID=2952227 RepID=A0ABT1TM81_9GAMM|nr:hypothetical protein [Methylomonas sp. WSC-7]MCQ8115885.1 hypothetical protein [Methylomonas sp. WSC-7]